MTQKAGQVSQGIETSSGVQALIARIRDEGVEAGREEAAALLAAAEQKAKQLLTEAEREATQLRESAHKEIEAQKAAAMEALRLAERDTILDLRSRIAATFERHLRRLVADATKEPEFIRSVVLTLAARVSEEHIKSKSADVLISGPGAEKEERARNIILGISREMLKDGVELYPASGASAGVRVRLHEEDIELDLSDDAVSDLLLAQLLPRYRAILDGED